MQFPSSFHKLWNALSAQRKGKYGSINKISLIASQIDQSNSLILWCLFRKCSFYCHNFPTLTGLPCSHYARLSNGQDSTLIRTWPLTCHTLPTSSASGIASVINKAIIVPISMQLTPWRVDSCSRDPQDFMDPKCFLPSSQGCNTGFYPKTDKSELHPTSVKIYFDVIFGPEI